MRCKKKCRGERPVQEIIHNMEINYDKLADAVSQRLDVNCPVSVEIDYKKLSDAINKDGTSINSLSKTWVVTQTVGIITSLTFLTLSAVMLLFAIALSHALYRVAIAGDFGNAAMPKIMFIFALLILINILVYIIAVLFGKTSWDIHNIKDKHYVVSLFSGITGFVAMIFAFIALFQDSNSTEIITLLTQIVELLGGTVQP